MSEFTDTYRVKWPLLALKAVLEEASYNHTCEEEFQEALGLRIASSGIPLPYREHQLSQGGRVDFYDPYLRLGIEAKVKGATSGIIRQLLRYAEAPEIDGLLLVTTRRQHLDIPLELRSKPVVIALCSGGAL